MNKKKISLLPVGITGGIIITLLMAFLIYSADFYQSDQAAIKDFQVSKEVFIEQYNNNTTIYSTKDSHTALIFYPGGKVEHTAYEPLMKACAEKGIMCILIEMPFNLAVFNINAADIHTELRVAHPEITSWYIGGHSLGGSMAGKYLVDNYTDFDGLILLGSYITSDLSHTELNVISIYGSEDNVLSKTNYDASIFNLPEDYTEIIINGGCHSYFGMYGEQKGDGTPCISNIEQIRITADEIEKVLGN